MASGGALLQCALLLAVAVYESYGGCTFPESWTGGWFQSGYPGLIAINSTHIYSKGECAETESFDKFLLYDRGDDCYRCMVIHEKHKYVLQYKETYCSQKDSLASICESISGDAPLYSMFRKEPRPVPQSCPFHSAPFTFTYSRGSGDCTNPPSRAEACTDDSRLLLRYMACPDVPGTESNVEELVCLATWKEGSTRYLVGQISQVRRNTIASDEDTYRCFIYKGQHTDKTMTYNIAQSGDATCNGLSSPTDGSRTMKLTTSDDEHHRCHFPAWVVEHRKWFSLDRSHEYVFTTKNATLKVMNSDGSTEEKRLVCHSILQQRDSRVQLVAHLTKGCESGHVCLVLARRGAGVMELWAGGALWEAAEDACAAPTDRLTTLTARALPPARCPALGRYSVSRAPPPPPPSDRRRRRQQQAIGSGSEGSVECAGAGGGGGAGGVGGGGGGAARAGYERAEVGCGEGQHTIEFTSPCDTTVYTCYTSWMEDGRGYLLAAPASEAGGDRTRALCFIYTYSKGNDTSGAGGAGGGTLSLSASLHSCDRSVVPGHTGDTAYNLTMNGTCEQSSKYNSGASRSLPFALVTSLALLVSTAGATHR